MLILSPVLSILYTMGNGNTWMTLGEGNSSGIFICCDDQRSLCKVTREAGFVCVRLCVHVRAPLGQRAA